MLNESPLQRLGTGHEGNYRTPLEVLKGLKPHRALISTFPVHKTVKERITNTRARQLINVEQTQAVMNAMHRDVADRLSKMRARAIALHNKKTNLLT